VLVEFTAPDLLALHGETASSDCAPTKSLELISDGNRAGDSQNQRYD